MTIYTYKITFRDRLEDLFWLIIQYLLVLCILPLYLLSKKEFRKKDV